MATASTRIIPAGPKGVMVLQPILEDIPEDLRKLPQWVVWRKQTDGKGRLTKVLYRASNPKLKAATTRRSTYSSFEKAWDTYQKNKDLDGPGRIDGIGFVFTVDDPYVGIDLDNCLDDQGDILPWARPYFDLLRVTYGEISPSGRGVKLIGLGQLPGKGRRKAGLGPDKTGAVEMYDNGRFFTITSRRHPQAHTHPIDVQDAVNTIHNEVFSEPEKSQAKPPPRDAGPVNLDDEALLEKARSAKNGAKFCTLFDAGDITGYPSSSEADLGLCKSLGWWFGLDETAVDRLFRRSALMREKWDEPRGASTYGRNTILKALEGMSECYSPTSKVSGRKAAANPLPNSSPPNDPTQPGNVGDEPERPAIEINTERHRVVEETIRAIALDPQLYSRGEMLVSVIREEKDSVKLTGKTSLDGMAGSPKIIGLSEAVIGCVLTRNVDFFQWKADKQGEFISVKAHPTNWLISAVASHKYWPGVRQLLTVVECPYPRADGSIVERGGYDPETGTLFLPSMQFQPVPENPTREDAKAAWMKLRRVIREFPFASEDDAVVFLAGLFNVVARPAIAGPVPGIAVVSNRAGTGKGLLINAIGRIAYGRDVPTSNYPSDPEEAGKVKVSIALQAPLAIHFDNLDEGASYGNSALDSMVTATTINDRIMGSSRHTGELPVRSAPFLTGNNITPGKDAHRRWLVSNFATDLERPEERKDIEVKDLKAHITERRGELVCAALTILKAHALEGRPTNEGWAPLGSFEEWDTVVRGAVWFATGRDCCATRRKAADDSPARKAKIALLVGWSELPEGKDGGATAAKAADLVEKDKESGTLATLRNALMHFGRDGKLASPRAIGTILRGMKGCLTEGLKFVEAGHEHGAVLWKVVVTDPNYAKPHVRGECGESGECDYPPRVRKNGSHNYASGYAPDAQRNGNGGEIHSPDSPHSPGGDEDEMEVFTL